jgi:hypothetical protein
MHSPASPPRNERAGLLRRFADAPVKMIIPRAAGKTRPPALASDEKSREAPKMLEILKLGCRKAQEFDLPGCCTR